MDFLQGGEPSRAPGLLLGLLILLLLVEGLRTLLAGSLHRGHLLQLFLCVVLTIIRCLEVLLSKKSVRRHLILRLHLHAVKLLRLTEISKVLDRGLTLHLRFSEIRKRIDLWNLSCWLGKSSEFVFLSYYRLFSESS